MADYLFYRLRIFLYMMGCLLPGIAMGQFSCGTANALSGGSCLTGQSFGGSGSAGCSGSGYGGSGFLHFYTFTAPANGNCVQFDFESITTTGNLDMEIWTSGCGSYVSGSLACWGAAAAGKPWSYSSEGDYGANLLTAGTSYVLRVWSKNGGTYDVCMKTSGVWKTSDECTGSSIVTSSPVNYYNGGDCDYSGSIDNGGALDFPASWYCAGSKENTKWFKYTASSTADLTLTCGNIYCTGGGCGYQFGIMSAGVGGTCASSMNSVGCASDGPGCGSGPDPSSTNNPSGRITFNLVSDDSMNLTIGSVVTGEVFYIVMDGNADSDCEFNLSISDGVLPVGLTSFRATQNGENVVLDWQTWSEINNSYFQVERSREQEGFEVIGKVKAAGNSSSLIEYSFDDTAVPPGSYRYQLRQYDHDGSHYRSRMIEILVENMEFAIVVGEEFITFGPSELFGGRQVQLILSDIQGKTIYSSVISGDSELAIPFGSGILERGVYLAIVQSGGEKFCRKVVVSR